MWRLRNNSQIRIKFPEPRWRIVMQPGLRISCEVVKLLVILEFHLSRPDVINVKDRPFAKSWKMISSMARPKFSLLVLRSYTSHNISRRGFNIAGSTGLETARDIFPFSILFNSHAIFFLSSIGLSDSPGAEVVLS